jgi:hypothetical protein
MDSEKILLFGGVAVAAYFAYEYFISPTAAASTLPAGVPATGIPTGFVATSGQAGSAAAPHAGDTWINAENQVIAQFNGSAWVASTAVAVSPAVPVTPAAVALSLASLYSQLNAAASAANPSDVSGGVVSMTPDDFNWYLAQIMPVSPSGTTGTWPPDPIAVFGGRPVMTISTYWAGMAPYLTSNFGMSGVIGLGLGCLAQQYRRGYVQNGELVLR